MIIDCHTHTHNSFDAAPETVRERCLRAIELGLTAMAVTDHCEVNRFYEKEYYNITVPQKYNDYNFKSAYENSMAEVTCAKEEFEGKLNLLCGIELGQADFDHKVTELITSDKRLDFIIGSMHELPGHEDFAFLNYKEENVKELLSENFKEILKLARLDKLDVLGHLTYTLRYIQGEQNISVDMSEYDDIIDEIFKTLIQNGKGIEINTSGLRQKYGATFPTFNYVKRYRELGGEIITVGSDSHSNADLAKGVPEGIEIAKQAGFNYIAYFKERKPVFLKI